MSLRVNCCKCSYPIYLQSAFDAHLCNVCKAKTDLTKEPVYKTPPPQFEEVVENRKFESGAQRNVSEGKGRCDLLPMSALLAVSKLYESGAKKFGEGNWQKGMPQNVFIDSGMRHLFQYTRGDQDEDHLVAAVWNLLNALDQRERFAAEKLDPALNNIPIVPK